MVVFARDRVANRLELFIVNESVNLVISGEPRIDIALMFSRAAIDIVRNAGVEGGEAYWP
jgi:hypothetical protein